MIVESIRLQHIKSYGAGPAGNGVTVAFQPGVNRIAGVNGCGKTTIVEALGYALFSALPVFEENFKAETYLLAHGAKAGEIDVTFSVDGNSYRLERGVGQQSKRRSKVVDVADGSICAEGDGEVAAFLCALLKLPSADRLSELFSKLVGVKQGRLVWPFDSKPKSAKEFFEPLLEVDVFRQCFDRLKPVVDAFARDRNEREKRQAVLSERIRERADASASLEAAGQKVEAYAERLASATTALVTAQAERARQEELEREVKDAASAHEQAAAATTFAARSRQEADGRLRESEEAAGRVTAGEPGYQAYLAATEALASLEERRKSRQQLRDERESACADVARLAGKRDAAVQQRDLLLGQQEEKRQASEIAAGELSVLNEELAATADAFEREQCDIDAVGRHAAAAAAWANALPALVTRMRALASGIAEAYSDLDGWNPDERATADNDRLARAGALQAARDAAARTGERIATLRAQLDRLAGGVCPFLGERCEQFDPAKVQHDLSALEATLVQESQAVEKATSAFEQAEALHARLAARETRLKVKRDQLRRDLTAYAGELREVAPPAMVAALQGLTTGAPGVPPGPSFGPTGRPASPEDVQDVQRAVEGFADDVAAWWPLTREQLERRTRAAALAKTERTRKETDARNLAASVRSLEDEVQGLGKKAAGKAAEATALEAQVASRAGDVAGLDDRLMSFEGLDEELDAQRKATESNRGHYESYLRARPLADDLEGRRRRLDDVVRQQADLAATLKACEERLRAATAGFVPDDLVAAKAECDTRSGEVAGAQSDLKHAQDQQGRETQRFEEWQAAVAASADVAAEIARDTAAIDITELARKTLKDAAPAVAQHLCTRIAVRAQAVYNQINPDPLELEWDAERYGLRITPGDRRFAMLSGGEQTKLALAMTLAMVEEFSRLRFCIFDEPTYGVDADSRRKLADAILQLQDAAGLDQLLLVSHDDAFEGRIEHTVLLTKSAAGGTAVEAV